MFSKISILRVAAGFIALIAIHGMVPASAMELQIVDSGLPLQVKLAGELMPGDADQIIQALNKAKSEGQIAKLAEKARSSNFDPRQWLWVEVESTGGSLDDNLKLGRYLRSANALITTKETCTSACVFLLAGAAERVDLAAAAGKIGVHRPYFTDARGRSQASLDEYFTGLHKELVSYLEQMHVPTILADMMFAVPPEEMRMLTADELAIMFPPHDPSWGEMTIARRAGFYGLPSIAYRQLQVQALNVCASTQGIFAKDLTDTSACPPTRATPITIDEFATNTVLFSGQCTRTTVVFVHHAGNGDYLSCLRPNTGPAATLSQTADGRVLLW